MAAEAVLGALLSVLFERLATRDVLDFARRNKLRSQLENWKTNLQAIKCVLGNAENRAMGLGGGSEGDDDLVTLWLDDLKDLAYDLEDLLDEFAAEEALESSSSKLVRSLLLPCSAVFTCKTRVKVNDIDRRLNDIMQRKERFGLMVDNEAPRAFGQWATRPPSTCLADSSIFGRDGDLKSILEAVNKDDNVDNPSMIFIVGMGGLGKTTLAQLVYNDETVKASFSAKAWACVSDVFDELSITRTILSSVRGSYTQEGKDLSALQEELKGALSGKKFLIVLDDVWNESYERWTLLRKPFVSSEAKGSKIIVTTRNQGVVSIMKSQTSTVFSLAALSDKDSLALLARHALEVEADDFEGRYSYLKPAAEKIVEKCGRLPLAIKTLGGALKSNDAHRDWEHIAETNIWDLKKAGDIPQALNLSYVYLPSELKRCFVYCAVFRKDHEFDKEDLISLWMAEGLLGKPHQGESMRDLGMKYFQELLDRSFFQPSNSYVKLFVMHDLMNDLAISKAGTSCLSLGEGRLHPPKKNMCPEKIRHLSLIPKKNELSGRFEGFNHLWRLRTFLLPSSHCYNNVAEQVIDDALRHAKHLRALSLYGYNIDEVPNCVGILKHLRYLNLSRSDIVLLPTFMSTLYNLETLILEYCMELEELPSWIGLLKHLRFLNLSRSRIRFLPTSMCTLYNLETLILEYCMELEELPGGLNKLINLSCLDISGTEHLWKMPRGMSNLIKLETLPKFIVGEGPDELRLSELKDMQFLRGDISLNGLCNVVDVRDAKDAALDTKPYLNSLFLCWERRTTNTTDAAASETKVLQWLRPHAGIKNITIEGYGGTKFPSWMGDISFVLLAIVRLRDCMTTETLPALGQLPLLKELTIVGMYAVRSVGQELYGDTTEPFPSLETMAFVNMPAWEQWSLFSAVSPREHRCPFPLIRELHLAKCPKLVIVKWPNQLPSLVKMVIQKCPLLETPDDTCINLPSLKEGEFRDCNGRMMRGVLSTSCSTMKRLTLFRVSISVMQGIGFLSCLASLEELRIDTCNELISLSFQVEASKVSSSIHSLKHLTVEKCHQLENIEGLRVEELRLVDCPKLQVLWEDKSNLKSLRVEGCHQIGASMSHLSSFASLEDLEIVNCNELMRLWWEEDNNKNAKTHYSLKRLKILGCVQLEKIGVFPASLEYLHLGDCSNLEVIPEDMSKLCRLEKLDILLCPSLMPIQFYRVPRLKMLRIDDSEVCLFGPNENEMKDSSLDVSESELELINICHSPKLKSINLHLLHGKFTRLTTLSIDYCPALELECFPQLPDSLQELLIQRCPGIKALPKEGLPPKLESLCIWDCENILKQPMSEWGFQRTTALKKLIIEGCLQELEHGESTSFPPPQPNNNGRSNWGLLPPSLTYLDIRDQPNLVIISSGMQSHLTCLENLAIFQCPKLRRLPRDGFPHSLQELKIRGCTKELAKRCKKEEEEERLDLGCLPTSKRHSYYPLVCRIPDVRIDI